VLGLDDLEELAYRALLEVPSADGDELGARVGTRAVEAVRLLTALERKGLVARSSQHAGRYVASPPTVALAALAVQRQEELRRAQVEIAALAEVYRNTGSERSVSDVIDVVHGPQAIADRFAQLQMSATHEVATLIKSDPAVVTLEENVEEDAAVGRGVVYRAVIERAALNRTGFLEAAEAALDQGEQIRVVPSVPIRLLIVDRHIALVPLASGASVGVGALLVHPGGLLDGLIALFDRVWHDAVPLVLTGRGVVEAAAEPIEDLDVKIFGLLLAGLTDQAVGNQLGLSLRTVQRRVRLLMDAAGAGTRLQLGFQAAQRGWV